MIHDTNVPANKPILPESQADSMDPGSRRINQNPEIVTMGSISSFYTTVSSGHNFILELTITNVLNNGPIVTFWEIQIFINDNSTTANLLYPYHDQSTVSLSGQWQYFGRTGTFIPNGTNVANTATAYTEKIVLTNITGSDQNLFIQVRPRYLFNRG